MTLNQYLLRSKTTIFIASLLTAYAWGVDEILECPPESIKIEFISPVTQSRKQFCGYEKDGSTIKHGFEWIHAKDGRVERKIYYEHGKEVPFVQKPKVDVNANKMAIAEIKQMLRVLVIHGRKASAGTFQVHKCDKNPRDWIRGAIMKTPIAKTYSFGEGCDVSGSFTATFGKDFPVTFDLRNLSFNKARVLVKMEVVPMGSMVKLKFKANEGFMTSAKHNYDFNAEYEVEINPMTGKADFNSQQGKIVLQKANGETVNVSEPLQFSM